MAVTRIDVLTEEQKAAMPAHAKEWIARGLDLTPADRPAAEAAYRECYRLAGLPEPKRIVWVKSPLALVHAAPRAALVLATHARGVPLDVALAVIMGREQASEHVRASVGDSVRASMGASVGDSQVASAVKRVVREGYWKYLGGRWWCGYWYGPAVTDFFRRVCGLQLPGDNEAKADAWERAQMAASWWYPHREFVIACEPPIALNRDEQGRLHCETGPSIAWGDGWALWHWHGQVISQRVIEHPETITVADIDAETNAEIRRVMIERYGTARYVVDSDAKEVDVWTDEAGQPVRLMRREVRNDEAIVMLHMINSTVDPEGTRREYWRRVPPTMTSAWAARNWTCQMPEGARFSVRS